MTRTVAAGAVAGGVPLRGGGGGAFSGVRGRPCGSAADLESHPLDGIPNPSHDSCFDVATVTQTFRRCRVHDSNRHVAKLLMQPQQFSRESKLKSPEIDLRPWRPCRRRRGLRLLRACPPVSQARPRIRGGPDATCDHGGARRQPAGQGRAHGRSGGLGGWSCPRKVSESAI